jgi:hypothetical protein
VSAGEIEGEVAGTILREIGKLSTRFDRLEGQSDTRHRALTNDVLEVRADARRAMEIATDAKRIADASALDTRDMQRAVIDHTKGLSTRQQEQAAQIAALAKETHAQTGSLSTLVEAERKRGERESVASALEAHKAADDDLRWKRIGRWWPFVVAGASVLAGLASAAASVLSHWKP